MAFTLTFGARLSLGKLTARQTSRDAADRSLAPPVTGLSTLGFDQIGFPIQPPACYRASWQLPEPDLHRQVTTSREQVVQLNSLAVPPTPAGRTTAAVHTRRLGRSEAARIAARLAVPAATEPSDRVPARDSVPPSARGATARALEGLTPPLWRAAQSRMNAWRSGTAAERRPPTPIHGPVSRRSIVNNDPAPPPTLLQGIVTETPVTSRLTGVFCLASNGSGPDWPERTLRHRIGIRAAYDSRRTLPNPATREITPGR
jgi:hypothetical protein